MNKLLTTAALAGVIAIAATAAKAEDQKAPEKVKCYGIAKAGKNSCKTDSHSCAGQAKTDNDASEWAFAATSEECEKAGGKAVIGKAM